MTAIPTKVRAVVHERSEGRCERCSRTGPLELKGGGEIENPRHET